jgi:hypothetical protein
MVAEREFTRRMLQTVLTVTLTVSVLAVLWTARSALMVIYVSGLIAVGFSPLVRFIERPARSGRHALPQLHWRRLVNGYSGGAPAQYSLWAERFKDVLDRPQSSWQAVVESRATHIVVHEGSYVDGRGRH